VCWIYPEILRKEAIKIEKFAGKMARVSTIQNSVLYIGSRASAAKSETFTIFNVEAILNVSDNVPFYFTKEEEQFIFGKEIQKLRIPVQDSAEEDLAQFFQQATDFIQVNLEKGKSVLVHCSMGISRSASIVIAYLIRFDKMSLNEAYRHLKLARDCICPNMVKNEVLEEF
jgi:protein-tyrosine phosphatase